MRGNVLAAIVAAAIIALLSVWRISENNARDLVDAGALSGTWVRASTESCNPPLPEKIGISDDGQYRFADTAGALVRDTQGRFTLQTEIKEHQIRVFRANADRLELLNKLGCKATYMRDE